MSAAETIAPTISETLSWAEICRLYPDEWVCIVEIERETPNGIEIRSARVIGHGKTRKEPFDQARPWRAQYELIGHFFTGRIRVQPLRPEVSSFPVSVFDLGHDGIDGLLGMNFLCDFNVDIRPAEHRLLVEEIAP